jgi:hypothetical protein
MDISSSNNPEANEITGKPLDSRPRGRPAKIRFEPGEIVEGKIITAEVISRVTGVPTDCIGTDQWNIARVKCRGYVKTAFKREYGHACFVKNSGSGLVPVRAADTLRESDRRYRESMREIRDNAKVCLETAAHSKSINQSDKSSLTSRGAALAAIASSAESRELSRRLWMGRRAFEKRDVASGE